MAAPSGVGPNQPNSAQNSSEPILSTSDPRIAQAWEAYKAYAKQQDAYAAIRRRVAAAQSAQPQEAPPSDSKQNQDPRLQRVASTFTPNSHS
jgi:hypothetical protein